MYEREQCGKKIQTERRVTKCRDFLDDISTEQREEINQIIFSKGDRVEFGPGPNGTVKISRVRREFLKSGRLKERPKS